MTDTETMEDTDLDFSLADIAQLDASSIAEVRFESLPAGLYIFRGTEALFSDVQNRDDERRIVLTMKMEVTEVKAVTERISAEDKEALVGKTHTEKQYVVPAKAAEGLGLIRTLFGDLGLPNEGPFGGVPEGTLDKDGNEVPPGFVDNFVGHEFTGKIFKQPRKGDPTQKDARLRLDPKKKTR